MPLFRRPNTAVVSSVAKTKSGSEITAFTYSGSASILGQLTEKTPGMAAENYGVDAEFAAVWLCNIADSASIKIGWRMVIDGRTYYVKAGPQIMNAESVTSHARYLLARDV